MRSWRALDDRLLVVVGSVQRARPRGDARLRPAAREARARAERRAAAWRCASTSRSRARRPAGRGSSTTRTSTARATSTPGCISRGACCWGCWTPGCPSAASSSIRSRRSTSPTRSPGGRSARAPPRARPTASSPPGSRCRSASRTGPTGTCRWRSTPCARPRGRTRSPGIDPKGRPAILYTSGNADCHVILRGGKGGAQPRRGERRGGAQAAGRRAGFPSA